MLLALELIDVNSTGVTLKFWPSLFNSNVFILSKSYFHSPDYNRQLKSSIELEKRLLIFF